MWFLVFEDSGFNRTLCGSKWESLTDWANAFGSLGSSTARLGCCSANTYMSSPFLLNQGQEIGSNSVLFTDKVTGTFVEAASCSVCPAGTSVSSLTSVPNDEISCQKCDAGSFSTQGSTSCQICAIGKSSASGSTSCDLTTIKLPNGNGELRVGYLGGIVDDILGIETPLDKGGVELKIDSAKKEIATKTYGQIQNWDMSDVTDLSFLFFNKQTLNPDLSNWNVAHVTNMEQSMYKFFQSFFFLIIIINLIFFNFLSLFLILFVKLLKQRLCGQ